MSIIRHPFLSLVEMLANLVLVGFPQGVGLGKDIGQPFQSLEQGRLAKRKIELRRVKDVEDDHLVPPMPEVLQAGDDPGNIVEHVREDRHDAPFLETLGQVVENDPHVRLLTELG